MKTVSAELAAHLALETTTVCTCWKITRVDGVVLGFTDHDADLVIEGVTFIAETGFLRTAITNTATVAPGELDAEGFLDNDILTPHDIRAGLYDYAKVDLFLVNWADLTQGALKLRTGNFGEAVITSTDSFKIELRGLLQRLEQQMIETYGPRCRASLGDSRCTIELYPPSRVSSHQYKLGDRVQVRNNAADTIVSLPLINGNFGSVFSVDVPGWILNNMTVWPGSAAEGLFSVRTIDWVSQAFQSVDVTALAFPVAEGAATFSVQAFSQSPVQQSSLLLACYDAGGTILRAKASRYKSLAPGYSELSVTLTIPAGTVRLEGIIRTNKLDSPGSPAGTTFAPLNATSFDAAALVVFPPAAGASVQTLVNPGFEVASDNATRTANWTLTTNSPGEVLSSVNTFEGISAPDAGGFFAVITGGVSGSGTQTQITSDPVSLLVGGIDGTMIDTSSFVIDLTWLAANVDIYGTSGVGLKFTDAGDASPSSVTPDNNVCRPLNEWQNFKKTIAVPTGARFVRFVLELDITASGNYQFTSPRSVITDVTGTIRPAALTKPAGVQFDGVEYVATTAGISDPTTPSSWSRVIGDTIQDGSVTWTVSQPKYVFMATIATVTSRGKFTFTGVTLPDQWLQWGVCEVLSGAAAGFKKDIINQFGQAITIAFPLPYMPAPGDQLLLQTGCDKMITTCHAKFFNEINFRGFPYMPGTDQYFQVGSPG